MKRGQTEVIFVIKCVLWYLHLARACSFSPMTLNSLCHVFQLISIVVAIWKNNKNYNQKILSGKEVVTMPLHLSLIFKHLFFNCYCHAILY